MMVKRTASAILVGAMLLLVACGEAETPEAAAGSVERLTAQMDREEAAAKARAMIDADARAKVRADEGSERIDRLERESRR